MFLLKLILKKKKKTKKNCIHSCVHFSTFRFSSLLYLNYLTFSLCFLTSLVFLSCLANSLITNIIRIIFFIISLCYCFQPSSFLLCLPPSRRPSLLFSYLSIFGGSWVSAAAGGLPLIAENGGRPLLVGGGYPCGEGLPLLRSRGWRHTGFSSCGSWAELLRGMWGLPAAGIEHMSPALEADC